MADGEGRRRRRSPASPPLASRPTTDEPQPTAWTVPTTMDPAAPFDEGTAGPTPVGSVQTPLDRGDVVNLMADLRGRLAASEGMAKLTDVQNRLVMQRLAEAGTWERPRESVEEQVEEIAGVVAKLSAIDEARVAETLEACLSRG